MISPTIEQRLVQSWTPTASAGLSLPLNDIRVERVEPVSDSLARTQEEKASIKAGARERRVIIRAHPRRTELGGGIEVPQRLQPGPAAARLTGWVRNKHRVGVKEEDA